MYPSDLDTRRQQSLNKVRDAWTSIINKYSALPEDKQGDIVDLATGEIVLDKGHLRSLKQNPDNLWAQHPHADQIEKLRQRNHNNKSLLLHKTQFVDLDVDQSPHIQIISTNYSTLPGDTNYKVSSSQHLTRSKVIGNDNLIVKLKSKPKSKSNSKSDLKSYTQPSTHLSSRSDLLSLDATTDPLNILSNTSLLDTPSKVRRLKHALDRPVRRRNIHKLIIYSKKHRP